MFADEARGAVAHRMGVEVPDGEKVLVVSRAAREARREGRCDGRPGVDATWIEGGRMASSMWRYRMSLAAVIVVVVDDKALASSPAGGAGVSSEACRPSEPDTPPSATRSPEVMSWWKGPAQRRGRGAKSGRVHSRCA